MSQSVVNRLKSPYLLAAEGLRGNPGQWEAYESRGHCVILAGPGSGKTKTLTIKMARILTEDVRPPRGVACLTFNSECARELKRRLEQLGVRESRSVFIGTVHSFCLKSVLLPYGKLAGVRLPEDLAVALPSEQERLFEQALAEVVGTNEHPASWKPRFDEYRRTRIDRAAPEWREDAEIVRLIETYEAKLREKGVIDFDDMVLHGLCLIEGHEWVRRALHARYPVLVVDEYQDLGAPLHRIVLNLCFGAGIRLLAVGDADQSIYGFAGARPELLRDLARRSDVRGVRLKFNYRSGKTIVTASEVALGERRGYEAKSDHLGTIDFYQSAEGLEEQAQLICGTIIPAALERCSGRRLGDIAVLYVDRNDGEVIAHRVKDSGMKFIRIDKGAPYPKTPLTRWLEECARWCAGGWTVGTPRFSDLWSSWLGFNRRVRGDQAERTLREQLVHFLFSHRSGDVLVREWLDELGADGLRDLLQTEPAMRDEREAYARLRRESGPGRTLGGLSVAAFGGQAGSSDHLNLITLHSAKGLEFDVVIMMGMEEGKIPRWKATTSQEREARRLFYVGLTRARHEVHMTYSGWTENRWGRRFYNGPSQFLAEVRGRLLVS